MRAIDDPRIDNLHGFEQFIVIGMIGKRDRMIDVKRLEPGERVEVVSDVATGSVLRYARTIHVLPEPLPTRPASAGRLRAYRSTSDRAAAAERTAPTGNLTFSGVVFRLTGERLVQRHVLPDDVNRRVGHRRLVLLHPLITPGAGKRRQSCPEDGAPATGQLSE